MLTISETTKTSFTRVQGQRYEEQHRDLHEDPKEDETTNELRPSERKSDAFST
jgi:hypothetical protein